jgi:hypothetical protein
MAKLTKHAEVLNQLHTMVKKQAEEAQKNISGVPGGDVKSVSVSDEHETTNKNSVGPENVAQGYHQKPSEDSSKPLSNAKSASVLGTEILDIIRKQAEAQDSATGAPGYVKSESVGDDQENVDKNSVKPESNKQDYGQKASTDDSKPLASAKKAEVEELAAKVASYELGRQFCAALLKAAGDNSQDDEAELMKQAGRRDFDLLISEAAENLEAQAEDEEEEMEAQAEDEYEEEEHQIKQAEEAGAAYFDELLKQAAVEEAIQENDQLKQKIAEYEEFIKQAYAEQEAVEHQQAFEHNQAKLAESVAATVLEKLKGELAQPA